MPWVAAGVAVASVAGSVLTADAQGNAIASGKREANARLQPYQDQGIKSLNDSADLLGLNGPDAATAAMGKFTASPGYAYQVQQGLAGVDAGAAARGTLVSSTTRQQEEKTASALASQDFGNYVGRLNDLTKIGLNAAGGQASTDTSAAGAQANILGNEGKGITSALGSLAGSYGGGASAFGGGGLAASQNPLGGGAGSYGGAGGFT